MSEEDKTKETIRYGVDRFIRQLLDSRTAEKDQEIIGFATNGYLREHAAHQELAKQKEQFEAEQRLLVERCAKLELEYRIARAQVDQSATLIKKLMGI